MAARPSKRVKSIDLSGLDFSLTTIVVNKNSSDKVDLVIVWGELHALNYFHVEKAALSLNSTFFKDRFKVDQDKKMCLDDNSTKDVILKGLRIMSGMIDKDDWSIDDSSDVINFGHKYGSSIVVQSALLKFCHAFTVEANLSADQPFNSRYGSAALVKFINLWRRMIQKDLFCTPETLKIFMWCIEHTWKKWLSRCNISGIASIADFMKLSTSKDFDVYDYCLTSEFIKRLQDPSTNFLVRDLRDVIQEMSEENDLVL